MSDLAAGWERNATYVMLCQRRKGQIMFKPKFTGKCSTFIPEVQIAQNLNTKW